VNNEHKIWGYYYNSLDTNTAGNHVLSIIHFICVYAKPYNEHCDIYGLNLVQLGVLTDAGDASINTENLFPDFRS
jgi:hypothetical protein